MLSVMVVVAQGGAGWELMRIIAWLARKGLCWLKNRANPAQHKGCRAILTTAIGCALIPPTQIASDLFRTALKFAPRSTMLDPENPESTHDYELEDWQKAKAQAKAHLVSVAKRQGQETYGGLVENIDAISFKSNAPALFAMLGQISAEEYRAGRGMLTAIVVHKTGDQMPGKGFYELARYLGLDASDKNAFWISETRKVWRFWKSQKD